MCLLSHTEHFLHKDPVKNGCSSFLPLGTFKHLKHNVSISQSPDDIARQRSSTVDKKKSQIKIDIKE